MPPGELWVDGENAVLETDYDAGLVERIRAIPGRRWDPYERLWYFSLTPDRARAVLGLVELLGDELELDPEDREALEELEAGRDPRRVLLEHTMIDRQTHVSLCSDWPADVCGELCGNEPVRVAPELGRRSVPLTDGVRERLLALVSTRKDVEASPALLERARRRPRARATAAGPDPGVRWRTGGWPSPALHIALPPRTPGLLARVRALPASGPRNGEWVVPAWPGAAEGVAALLAAAPELEVDPRVRAWLGEALRWGGIVTVLGGREERWLALHTERGVPPRDLAAAGEERGAWLLLPPSAGSAALVRGLDGAELDPLAKELLETGELPRGGELSLRRGELVLEPGWDRELTAALLHDVEGARAESRDGPWHFAQDAVRVRCPLDLWALDELEPVLAGRDLALTAPAATRLDELRALRAGARDTAAASRARDHDALTLPPLGGELRPFQRAGVAYALSQRRTFLADEQGLGKTIEALAALEADGAFPAVVVCPASLKLNWRREAERWLPGRSIQVIGGGRPRPVGADVVVLNYEILAAHAPTLAAVRPRALVLDEAHYVKNAKAQRTRAALELSEALAPDALRLALTGTPVLNRPAELVAPLRVLGRLADVGGSAEGFKRRFAAPERSERLHEALRSTCFLRRLKTEVLPQLPAKEQTILPVALTNQREYRAAEEDVIAWLRNQPGDLRELDARVARALRAEQLARLNALRILAARGKLAAALAWIEDFLASGERLVVFARLREVQAALLARFPTTAHVLGADSLAARHAAVAAFQETEDHQLIICSLEAGGQGITLTRASHVCFLELDWTPARHDQAEDRCHRMGQEDAVTAWYLLAAETIDEAMAEVLERKRATIGAVTDGRAADEEGMVDAVVRALREKPRSHLRVAA